MIIMDNLSLIVVLPTCLEVLSPHFLKNSINEFESNLDLLVFKWMWSFINTGNCCWICSETVLAQKQ